MTQDNAISSSDPDSPTDAIHAATHADPYPFYANLRRHTSLVRDPRLDLWIAASAESVTEILGSPDCCVRPGREPVPAAIQGTPAGEIFAQLVRMNDGERHARPKLVLQRALGGIDLRTASTIAERTAAGSLTANPDDWTNWAFDVPLHTVGSLLGFAQEDLPPLAAWTRDFVACLSPLSSTAALETASAAAQSLLMRFKTMLAGSQPAGGSLLAAVVDEASNVGWNNADAILANLVGLLSQTCDASAGWIGNGIVALHRQAGMLEALRDSAELLGAFVAEVGRFDPAIQNTRRFVSRATRIGGHALQEGDAILVLLAAANRDPAANPEPGAFLLERQARRSFGFGHGGHACPGQALAHAIVSGALRAFVARDGLPAGLAWSYRPSVNARIPNFLPSQNLEGT